MNKNKFLYLLSVIIVFLSACSSENTNPDIIGTPYSLNFGTDLPQPLLPEDNVLTEEGVMLGRMLFYEPALSSNGEQSCAGCHIQQAAFVDSARFSLGVAGLEGKRNSMPLFNLAWHNKGFFWDGRAATLREQALLPIQDELEMDESLDNVVTKIRAKANFTEQFERTFGDDAVTSERIGLAIEQFMMSIVSNNSKFDKWRRNEAELTEAEQRGHDLFFAESNLSSTVKGADCFHCHGGSLFTNNDFMNNGLDTDAEFTDLGYYETTQNDADKAKFKVPSLRNIALSPPYMHDGRFETLEEVLIHYNTNTKVSSTIDPNMHAIVDHGLNLSEEDMQDIIAFLHTLTDNTYLNNIEYADPF